jgi:AraC family transcriptional regulator
LSRESQPSRSNWDPSRTVVPPLIGLDVPALRYAMLAVNAELRAGGAGGALMIESLATVLAVHLIRDTTGVHRPPARANLALPRRKLRPFKAATGLPPHQYVIGRRFERAQRLPQADRGLGLAEAALGAGFSDQSKFSFHCKRMVGVTPGQLRISARIA